MKAYPSTLRLFRPSPPPSLPPAFRAAGELGGKVVSENAKAGTLAGMALDIFAGAYGSEAGVAGLKWMPFGGLFITGGLTPKNIDRIAGNDSLFMAAFQDKGRVSPFLKKIPLYAVLVEDLGERGAQWVAIKVRGREDRREGGEERRVVCSCRNSRSQMGHDDSSCRLFFPLIYSVGLARTPERRSPPPWRLKGQQQWNQQWNSVLVHPYGSSHAGRSPARDFVCFSA